MARTQHVFVRYPGDVKQHGLWPSEMKALSTYNAEAARGLVHTRDWIDTMIELQARFDESDDNDWRPPLPGAAP